MNLLSIFQPQFALENSSLILGHAQRILSVCNASYLANGVVQDDAINATIAILKSFLSTDVSNTVLSNTTTTTNPSAPTSYGDISVEPIASIPVSDDPIPVDPIPVDLVPEDANTVDPTIVS